MSSRLVHWDHLVRYIPKGEVQVEFGEPILTNTADEGIIELASKGKLQVKICEGDDDVLSIWPTGRTHTVKTLLGPLEPKDVPIIYCIVLNYKTHSELFLKSRPEKRETLVENPKLGAYVPHIRLFLRSHLPQLPTVEKTY